MVVIPSHVFNHPDFDAHKKYFIEISKIINSINIGNYKFSFKTDSYYNNATCISRINFICTPKSGVMSCTEFSTSSICSKNGTWVKPDISKYNFCITINNLISNIIYSREQHDFCEFLLDTGCDVVELIENTFKNDIYEANVRMINQISNIINSPNIEREHNEWFELSVVDEIECVLKPYTNIPLDMIQNAVSSLMIKHVHGS